MPKIHPDQWTLGQLISALEKVPHEAFIYFDFVQLCPGAIQSYRGFYEDLAIGFEEDDPITVGILLSMLKSSLNDDFVGYKGGTYTMHKDTALWVANYGRTSSTIIVGVDLESEHEAVILTKRIKK